MQIFLRRISAAFVEETPDKSWELGDSGVSPLAQLISQFLQEGSESGDLSRSYSVGLGGEARPVDLMSILLKSRQALLYYC